MRQLLLKTDAGILAPNYSDKAMILFARALSDFDEKKIKKIEVVLQNGNIHYFDVLDAKHSYSIANVKQVLFGIETQLQPNDFNGASVYSVSDKKHNESR